ncbi:VanW family protein [Geodermatophilus marinus]|uniref:VanW family protein n=1 Tax=Geodermatophilus sp. LHW52908 TaxID=2303986 RepID=UPI000E3E60BA|nr:VanW family protein [Geodermatophilus sp. LHW52908]RFU19010.1 vanomycin resistance protein VanB [Geodermatophilus sp. LHW52908]
MPSPQPPAAQPSTGAPTPDDAPGADDTRPVPRDRGPVETPGDAAEPATPAQAEPAQAEPTTQAGPATAGDPEDDSSTQDIRFAPGARPGAAPEPPAAGDPDDDSSTQDIRFAPGAHPGAAPEPPAAGATPATAAQAAAEGTPTAPTEPVAGHPSTAPAGSEPDGGTVPDGGPVSGSAPESSDPGSSAPDRGPGAGHDGGPGDGGSASGGPGGGPGEPGSGGGAQRPWWRRPVVLAPAAALALLGGAYGVDLLVAGGHVPRNTVVAGVELGGLSPAAATETLETELAPRVAADHVVVADDVEATLSPATAGIELDVDATVDAAADQPLNPWTRLTTFFTDREVDPVMTGEETALAAQIDALAEQVDRAPVDATIAVEGTDARVVDPVDGRTLDREGAAETVTEFLADGGDPATPIELPVETIPVRVDAEEARRVLDEVVAPGLAAPVTVTSQDGGTSAEVPAEAIAASLTFTPQDDGELAVALDPAALQEAVGDGFSAFGTPAEDARFEVAGEAVSLVPSVDGTGVAPDALATQLRDVLPQPAPRTVTAELGPVEPEFSTADAEALGIREQISTFTTNFTSAASGTNIRVAAGEIDGAIIRPGETFSLNDYTGPRTEAQGYVPAGVINNGEFTTAVGGGVSQVATTLFNAVFFAGLEDVYHKPHSYYISRYPAGREATVYYDTIDLEFRNDSDTGVYVDTQWTPGSLTVSFYGTKRYEIESISSSRYNIRQPVVQEKPDDGDCSPSNGSTGFDITVTRVFNDLQGNELRREDFRTRYAAEPIIRCVPPEPEPKPEPAPGGAAPASAPAPAGRRPGAPARRRTPPVPA